MGEIINPVCRNQKMTWKSNNFSSKHILTIKGWRVIFKYYKYTKGFNKRHGAIFPQFIFSIQFSETKQFFDYDLKSMTKIAMNT